MLAGISLAVTQNHIIGFLIKLQDGFSCVFCTMGGLFFLVDSDKVVVRLGSGGQDFLISHSFSLVYSVSFKFDGLILQLKTFF